MTEFYDWRDAARAFDLNEQLKNIKTNILSQPVSKNQAKKVNSEIRNLENQMNMALGNNPFKVSEENIRLQREARIKANQEWMERRGVK